MEAIQAKAGASIILETQPANSPDLKVNDLGYFYPIWELEEDVGVSSPEDLVEATKGAFDVYPRETLERVWQRLFESLGKSLALRVIIATSCPIWARRISVGQANFRSTSGWMRKNTVSERRFG
ncbi:unnamed protein product, partial [Discosporangium mesarthrocarpum]